MSAWQAPNGKRSGAPVVETEEWLSRERAAEAIGISQRRVRWLIVKQELGAVQDSVGRPGVSRESVDGYVKWRRSTGPVRRALHPIGQVVAFLLDFFF